MKIAIVQFPGSNCERETMLAVQRAGMSPIEFLWNESPSILQDMDGFVIVGGFSYEDRSRAGIIAALDPVMNEIKRQSESGKPVLGICNGAQILVETGLVPGLEHYKLGMVLTDNKRIVDGKIWGTGFYNAWIHMRPNTKNKNNAFTRKLSDDSILTVPIAHAEGRFQMPKELFSEIESEGLNVFSYCDAEGSIHDNFPVNPNGSIANMAAVMNKAGNIMAMMPHPERTPGGDGIFISMKEYIQERQDYKPSHLSYIPKKEVLAPYQKDQKQFELLVKLVITDNYALTVQNTLRELGIPVKVTRLVHWQIDADSSATIDKLKHTGILFNNRKEYLISSSELAKKGRKAFLVHAKEDMVGQQKLQMIQDHFAIDGVKSIQHSIVWMFDSEDVEINELIDSILTTNIIFNPNSHNCYDYKSFE